MHNIITSASFPECSSGSDCICPDGSNNCGSYPNCAWFDCNAAINRIGVTNLNPFRVHGNDEFRENVWLDLYANLTSYIWLPYAFCSNDTSATSNDYSDLFDFVFE